MMQAPIYLDYAATTPVDPLVAQAMHECLGEGGDFANPASATHLPGRRAQARIERARAEVAALIAAEPSEIIFTSGATESNNLAVLGVARANADLGRHVVTSRIEHRAVLDPCRQLEKEGFAVTYLAPDCAGRIAPAALAAALRADTVLVSLMHVNNEIGVIQDIAAVGALCRARDIPLHTDAAQAAGKLAIDVRALCVDFLSLTAHKLYGPKGIGALFIRAASRGRLAAVSFGGGQERGLRPGTLPTHQIVGFGVACRLAHERAAEAARLTCLRDRLWRGISPLGGTHLNGEAALRIPDILSVSIEGVEGESLVAGLAELAVSTGSACSSATGEPSYVLRALGRSTALAQSTLRFSLGRRTTEMDIDRAVAAVGREVTRLREVSPAHSSTIATNRAILAPLNAADKRRFDILAPSCAALFNGTAVRRRARARPRGRARGGGRRGAGSLGSFSFADRRRCCEGCTFSSLRMPAYSGGERMAHPAASRSQALGALGGWTCRLGARAVGAGRETRSAARGRRCITRMCYVQALIQRRMAKRSNSEHDVDLAY